MQIVKQVGVYKLIELDISTGVYSDVHTVQLDTAVDAGRANPSLANAFAINPTNDIAYGKFTDSNTQDFFCRFAANQTAEPMECLCALSAASSSSSSRPTCTPRHRRQSRSQTRRRRRRRARRALA